MTCTVLAKLARKVSFTHCTCALAAMCVAVVILSTGCPEDTTPPGIVTNFTANAGDAQVVLGWVPPGDADLAGVKILRKTGTAPSSSTDGTVVYDGMGSSHTDYTAANGVQYFYAAFAYDTSGNISAAAQATATPTSANAEAEILDSFDDLDEATGSVPDNVLTAEQRGELQDILMGAELLYRGDDACGAGEVLFDQYLAKLQLLRQGNAIITVEELYNMGRMLRFDMLANILLKSECPGAERIGMEADTEVEDQDSKQLAAMGKFGEPIVRTVRGKYDVGGQMVEETFTQVDIPGTIGIMGDPGSPGVPIFRRLFAVPRGSEPMLLLTKQNLNVVETIKMNLCPAQPSPADAPPDSEVFQDRPFVKNTEAYENDDYYPPDPVKLTYLGDGRDLEFYLLEIAAGRYRPKSGIFELFGTADVGMDFEGGSGAFLTDAMLNPFESNSDLYTGAAINARSAIRYIEGRVRPVPTGEEFMILTHPDFLAAANTLRDWKRSIGISTNVYLCGTDSDISGRETKEEIDAFIESHYSSVLIRPSYILLLGDAEFIEPFLITHSLSYETEIMGTDWPYAILGDVGDDNVPDFALGRISVDTLAEANIVVNKIIQYEDNPPMDTAFYNNATVAGLFQCCRTDVANVGTDQRSFIEVSEFARNAMITAGKTVDRFYTETIDAGCGWCTPPRPAYTADPTPRRYYNGTLLPTSLGPTSGFAWDGDTADVVAAWNAGRFLMLHRDHGWEHGWSDPEFETTDIDDLTNGALLPVVFSVNCASGYFDNETSGGFAGTVYFAEKLLRESGKGAVGVLGDTRNSPTWANTALTQGFFDAIWPSAIGTFGDATSHRRLGDILNHGKLYMMSRVGFSVMGKTLENADAVGDLYLWHCFGDPTMKIWTGYPYFIVLPNLIVYRYIHLTGEQELQFAGGINVEYERDGAEITVFEENQKQELEPIGRGIVHDGIADLMFLREHDTRLPLEFYASFENARSKPLGAKRAD